MGLYPGERGSFDSDDEGLSESRAVEDDVPFLTGWALRTCPEEEKAWGGSLILPKKAKKILRSERGTGYL